jgi:hypothetical protein
MARIFKAFISYRRHDAYIPLKEGGVLDYAFIEGLRSALKSVGFDDVFVDTGNIKVGENYESKIYRAVSESDLIVAVVGNKWLDILREKAASGERDTLLREIRAGLRQEKEIIPLLVDGVAMPAEGDLPQEIKPFHYENGLAVKSTDAPETIATALADKARQVTEARKLDSRWVTVYRIIAAIAYVCCAILPLIVGWLEFGLDSWLGMAAIWSGLFFWPAMFLLFALVALRRPILVLVDTAVNSRGWDRLTYLSPLLFGALLAVVATALELSGDETPWSVYPALPGCSQAAASELRPLSAYDQSNALKEDSPYLNRVWLTQKCWPDVFYYLTVPLLRGTPPAAYLVDRKAVARTFNMVMRRDIKVAHSWTFLAYLVSFLIFMLFGCTGIVMSIFYAMVQIRRPDDDSVLRLPSENAFLCLTYTLVTVMIWIPFRINTDYFKYLYSCDSYPNCDVDLKLYLTDAAMAAMLLLCYLFLTVGLIGKFGRMAARAAGRIRHRPQSIDRVSCLLFQGLCRTADGVMALLSDGVIAHLCNHACAMVPLQSSDGALQRFQEGYRLATSQPARYADWATPPDALPPSAPPALPRACRGRAA